MKINDILIIIGSVGVAIFVVSKLKNSSVPQSSNVKETRYNLINSVASSQKSTTPTLKENSLKSPEGYTQLPFLSNKTYDYKAVQL